MNPDLRGRSGFSPTSEVSGNGQPLLRCLNSGIHALVMPSPVLAKRNRPPADSRYAACRPQLTAAQGPRVERRAIGQPLLRCLNSGIHALAMPRTRYAWCADAIHVLHCFQRKAAKTSKADLDLAAKRYRDLRKESGQ